MIDWNEQSTTIARLSCVAALKRIFPSVEVRVSAPNTVEVTGSRGTIDLGWTSSGLTSPDGETWIGRPRSSSRRARRVGVDASSARSARMAEAIVERLSRENSKSFVCCSWNELVDGEERWLGLTPEEMVRLLATVDIYVHVADEWESPAEMAPFFSAVEVAVVDHAGCSIRRDTQPGETLEKWSADEFVDATIRLSDEPAVSDVIPNALLERVRSVI